MIYTGHIGTVSYREERVGIQQSAGMGFIQLKFGPRWKYISVVRAFIQSFLAVSISDIGKADKIAMAASELLENAVKYASEEETNIQVEVMPDDGERIAVTVQNTTTPESASALKTLFSEIMDGEPLEAYMKRMREAALRSDGKSQLGLARIRYETGGEMCLEVADSGRVTISLVMG